MASDEPTPDEPQPIPLDPRFAALVTTRFRPEIVRSHVIRCYVGELPFHLDPVAWRTGFLEVHEGGPPMDVREGMTSAVPQAQLRDLYRPVYSSSPVPLEWQELPLDPGGRKAMAELRGLTRREPVPQLVRSPKLISEDLARRRAFLQTPWQAHMRDEEPRRNVFVAIEPSLTR